MEAISHNRQITVREYIMSGLFYNLGRKLGPKVRKAKWLWQSVTGTEADAIRVEHEVGRDLAREIKR